MCCMFTCCGWMVDLIQRFWTFTMSCCISSAICCMLVTASMAGVALGYNYSLAEYMDLKETNVSVFMKRGIFDDEIADVQFRRGGQMDEKNLKNAEPDDTTPYLRSGRRLDDSVFETGDQHRYEGNLMRLTAKPAYSSTHLPGITDDFEMANIATAYPKDSLDSLKAVQSLIDARKSMANRLAGGTTVSPVPTYPFNEAERIYPNMGGRRIMPNIDYRAPLSMHPARLAVPSADIGSRLKWQGPKNPEVYGKVMQDYGLHQEPITYPSPIILYTGPIRPSPTSLTPGRGAIFLTRVEPFSYINTEATNTPEVTTPPSVESFKDKIILENEMIPRHKTRPKSDEDYDYDAKGLPVRKRRSIELNIPLNDKELRRDGNKESDTINSVHNVVSSHISIKMSLFSLNTNELKTKISDIHQENNNKDILNKENPRRDLEQNIQMPLAKEMDDNVSEKNVIAQLLSNLEDIKKSFFQPLQNDILVSDSNSVKTNNSTNTNDAFRTRTNLNVNRTDVPIQQGMDTKSTNYINIEQSAFAKVQKY